MIRYLMAAVLVCILVTAGCSSPQDPGTVDIVRALSSDGEDACFDRAKVPGIIKFPEDHGPHDTFKTEWWYYTGNLKTAEGRHFGYQLTFFRQALACETPSGTSAWRTSQLYFAHFAITDTRNRRFHSAQRMNRGSAGLAGATAFHVWIDDWNASASSETGKRTVRLTARERGGQAEKEKGSHGTGSNIAVDLSLIAEKTPIFQGDRGLSRKGPGNASYYYSFPGMVTKGFITVGTETYAVSGRSWFDHEWSTSALGADVTGWDWFAIHIHEGPLSGTDIMVCQVRNSEGLPNGYGFGSVSFAGGRFAILRESQFSIRPEQYWKSPETGRTYPAGWTIRLNEPRLSLDVTPVTDGQEHTRMFPYYEGAIRVAFPGGSGLGYVEMTGY
ncbi:MAG: carotenoid 1,2-hydratase [Desulfobacterales bacterium]|nr:carotenoid 1,2-hydratase [Desulfobacterales bacterium]